MQQKEKIAVAVNGVCGRMGREIVAVVRADTALRFAAAIERAGHPSMGTDVGTALGIGSLNIPVESSLVQKADVAIDFSSPEGTERMLAACLKEKIPLVVGTTGLLDSFVGELKKASKSIPILQSRNMSIGVNLLLRLVKETAAALGDDFDVEIIEAHHRFKKDSPSGTALALAEAAADGLKRGKENFVYGRKGMVGERPRKEIGIHAIRAGDIVGDHTVLFSALGERVELVHRAHTRGTLAYGAVRAAKFLVGKKAGWYEMKDVLAI